MKSTIDIDAHVMHDDNAPAVYVGTYAKYVAGDLSGAWLDLTTFEDVDEFYNVARALHADEKDPEFMFQDFQGFPRELYAEASGKTEIERIIDFALLDDDEQEILTAWLAYMGLTGQRDDITVAELQEEAQEAFVLNVNDWREANNCPFMDSAECLAYSLLDDGVLDLPEGPARDYFDFKRYGEDVLINDCFESNGIIFSAH